MKTHMVRLTVAAKVEELEQFCAFVRQGATATQLSPEETAKLDLVLEELFMNVARHAYAPGTGDVEIGYMAEGPGRLTIEISDTGVAFDPLASDPPDFSRGLAERPLGGMGIFLVKALATSMRYERVGNRNTLSFVYGGDGVSRPA